MDDPLNLTGKYILDENGESVECVELIKWAMWYENADNRRVAFDKLGRWSVSTVFLGINQNFGKNKKKNPILFETMVFAPGLDDPLEESLHDMYREQSGTKDEALAVHRRCVAKLRAKQRSLARN